MKNYIPKVLLSFMCTMIFLTSGCGESGDSGGSSPNTSSQSGSTAAMLPHKNALYILDNHYSFKVFDISSSEETTLVSENRTANFSETLFIYDDYLYIGGQGGVQIYDVKEPLNPVEINFYPHARGCDPIIVQNDIGYITLRSRPGCNGDTNRLEIVDFTDPTSPIELTRFPMDFPFGLAQTEDYLAVCQEGFGLSLVDITIDRSSNEIKAEAKEVANYNAIKCFDLIFSNGILFATVLDGIHQFRMDGIVLSKVSTIPVGPEQPSI